MKKLLALLLVVIGLFSLAACQNTDVPNHEDPDPVTEGVFKSDEDRMGFSVVSAVTMLSETNQTVLQSPQSIFEHLSWREEGLQVLNEIEVLERYLAMINTFMGEGNGFSVAILEGGLEDYDHQMVITMTDITGDVISYTFYYNETVYYADADDDDDDDEQELESTLEGIMFIGDVQYFLTGYRSLEAGEESLELTARIDDENYVTLIYEIEQDQDELETNFEYELFINNQLFQQIIIEFEREEDEVAMSLFFKEGLIEREYDFEIEYDNNEITIEIEYKFTDDGTVIEEGSIEISVWFDPATDTFKISYEIEVEGMESVYIERNYKDEDDDDDDDDHEDEADEDDEADEEDEEDDDDVEEMSSTL